MSPLALDSPVQFVKGAGPSRATLLAQAGIYTVADLLTHWPRDYQFRPHVIDMAELREGCLAAVCGIIDKINFRSFGRLPRLEMEISDDTGSCRVVWFHGGYLRKQFTVDRRLLVWGKVQSYDNVLQLANPEFEILKTDNADPAQLTGRIVPVYPAIGSLKSTMLAKLISRSLNELASQIPEWFTSAYRAARDLPSRSQAYRWMHAPATDDQPASARRCLAYDELFLMELGIALRHWHSRHGPEAVALPSSAEIEKRIRARFPFDLTAGQEKVIAEITADLAGARPMNRLLQGDVGSGKTVVALHAALLAVANSAQAAIMAPTEILAEQHFERIEKYLAGSRVRRVLLTGGLTGKARTDLLSKIADGDFDIVVGTQALLEKDVLFNRLGLVVVDEQHKFGVRQRARVRAKGTAPHCLVMTATPIPRTLALTVFGDLDVSILDDFPPGRKPVTTRLVPPDKITDAFEFVRKHLAAGRQAYVVYPLIDSSDDSSLKAATDEADRLQREVFPEFTVGLIHGRMSTPDKDKTMSRFRAGYINLLVSTVVIEVGVDVPNATVMLIENAERFGLAQLHQLRGRIARGSHKGFCLILARPTTEDAQRRLDILKATSDGFRIAEEDLRIRGPGHFFGTRQHGLPELRLADIINDMDLLRLARKDAFQIIKDDPKLSHPDHQNLRIALQTHFAESLELIDVG